MLSWCRILMNDLGCSGLLGSSIGHVGRLKNERETGGGGTAAQLALTTHQTKPLSHAR